MLGISQGRTKHTNRRKQNKIFGIVLTAVMLLETFCGQGTLTNVLAQENQEQAAYPYSIYVDTAFVGEDSELCREGIGAVVYDGDAEQAAGEPVRMEPVSGRDGIYRLGLEEKAEHVFFTKGTKTEERTAELDIDWTLGAPCFRPDSENLAEGGSFYGLYTVYFDLNDAKDAALFAENGIGVYAYDSATESCAAAPVAMKASDRGEGIYEYSFDRPYTYIAFMGGFGDWDYTYATTPVYTEWRYASPCFLLEEVNADASAGLWRNLTCVLTFDASGIREDEAFLENGVWLYAYRETADGGIEELSEQPVQMLASSRGADYYEYTLDKPYENVRFLLGDSFDAEIQTDVISIDWLSFAAPCYRMTLQREETTTEETTTEETTTEETTTEETTEETTTEETATEETVTEETVTEETTTEEATTEEATTEETTTEETATEETATGETETAAETETGGAAETETATETETTTVAETEKETITETAPGAETENPTEGTAGADTEGITESTTESTAETQAPAETGATTETTTGSETEAVSAPTASDAESDLSEASGQDAPEPAAENPEAGQESPSGEEASNAEDGLTAEVIVFQMEQLAAEAGTTETKEIVTESKTEEEITLHVSDRETNVGGGTDTFAQFHNNTVSEEGTTQKESSTGATEGPAQTKSSSSAAEGPTQTESSSAAEEEQVSGNDAIIPDNATDTELTTNPEDTAGTGNAADAVSLDGDLYDMGGSATLQPRMAAVGLRAVGGLQPGEYVYLDVSTANWPQDNAVISMAYSTGGSTFNLIRMDKLIIDGTQYYRAMIPEATQTISFKRFKPGTTNGTEWPGNTGTWNSTTNLPLSDATSNCYYLNSTSDWNSGKWRTPGVTEIAGNPIYFRDMTEALQSDIRAFFYDTSDFSAKKEATFVNDVSGYPYVEIPDATCRFVEFQDTEGKTLGIYNFYGEPTDHCGCFEYQAETRNTFFYGATKKPDGSVISGWGAKPDANVLLAGKKLYFDKLFFPAKDGGKIQIGTGTPIELTADSEDSRTLSYTIPADSTATQNTVITFVAKDKTEYRFLWSRLSADSTDNNKVIVENDVAAVSGTYAKGYDVYFDATLSKLSYEGSTPNTGTMPMGQNKIYWHAWNSDTDFADGEATKVSDYQKGDNIWKDVYVANLEKQYTNILFYSSAAQGTYPAANTNSTSKSAQTQDLVIDWEQYTVPCFYADTSDDAIYSNVKRSGYWDEVYTIRDAEKGKKTDADGKARDVVDIKQEPFSRSTGTLYVDSTFYDYYTDYELNGNNRDNYGGTNGMSQRNWVTFRQFDQALSEYYRNISAQIPIYTGHFQPSIAGWGTQFSEVAQTLNLYGYDKYSAFFSTNNSSIDVNGGDKKYDYAAQGLVESELADNGNLVVKGGTATAPHFNEEFLLGNNGKNAVLGEVYHNVAFPFKKKDVNGNGVEYWFFDSAETTLAMKQDSGSGEYYLKDVGNQEWSKNVNSSGTPDGTDGVSTKYGFFPFNETATAGSGKNYNYGFGTKLEFKFRLTEAGTVKDKSGNDVPITFEFSGDDDVWVFIDGKLALDVGGAHGRVEGTLDFKSKTATVSNVKASAGSTNTSNTAQFEIAGSNSDEHTLTMFYMERGMWESNMKISFNFPDENQLEVEKQVDKTEVNDMFKECFDSQSLFTFAIKNLATHYGSKEIIGDGEAVTPKIYNDSFAGDRLSASVAGNTFAHTNNFAGKDEVAHWFAGMNDITGAYREKRYGIVQPADGNAVDISNMSYLEFKYYYEYPDNPSLSNMYLQLVDTSGKIKGNFTDYLSGKTYGAVTMSGRNWVTVKLDLSKLGEQEGFNNQVAKIKFGYNYPRNIYLDDFIFYPASTAGVLTGFITKQYDIPDYGSATSGKLEIPAGAKYTSSNGGNYAIGADGTFVLENEETVIFRDQFRRGSYISLKEVKDEVMENLFTTSWTMFENGQAVASMKQAVPVIIGSKQSLTSQPGNSVDDDRTEQKLSGYEDGENLVNAYQGTKPDEDTFVFRSYAEPEETSATTKLKVVFYNKANTGSLTVSKAGAFETDVLSGSYSFLITFTNVGGIGLENAPITKMITLEAVENADGTYSIPSETISGIPVGTQFVIEELKPEDGSTLERVEVTPDNTETVKYDPVTKLVTGSITAQETAIQAEFQNTKKPVVDVSVEKLWKRADGSILTEQLPHQILVQLQRREKESNAAYAAVEEYKEIILTPAYVDNSVVWKYEIEGLDKTVDYTQAGSPEWEYRFVEIDETGKPIEEGGILSGFTVSYNTTVITAEPDGGENASKDTFQTIITNKLVDKTDLQITKKDATDQNKQINGVTFQLEKVEKADGSDSWTPVQDFETVTATTAAKDGENGIAVFSGLEDGDYRLTETKAADGYNLLAQSIIVHIEKGKYSLDDGTATAITDNLIQITILNTPKLVLPATGGAGPIPVTLGGIMLFMIANLMYIYFLRKRRKEATAS